MVAEPQFLRHGAPVLPGGQFGSGSHQMADNWAAEVHITADTEQNE